MPRQTHGLGRELPQRHRVHRGRKNGCIEKKSQKDREI